jgi:hypothetical protein
MSSISVVVLMAQSWGSCWFGATGQTLKDSPQPHCVLDVGVAELEALVQQAGLDEVDFHAVDALRLSVVDDDLDAVALEHLIAVGEVVGVVDDVGEAGASALLGADAQPTPCPRFASMLLTCWRRRR